MQDAIPKREGEGKKLNNLGRGEGGGGGGVWGLG